MPAGISEVNTINYAGSELGIVGAFAKAGAAGREDETFGEDCESFGGECKAHRRSGGRADQAPDSLGQAERGLC